MQSPKRSSRRRALPYALRLTRTSDRGGLRADGSDLVLVDVEVVDAKGRRVPIALNMVHFTLNGPAEWRGGIARVRQSLCPSTPLSHRRTVSLQRRSRRISTTTTTSS